MKALLSLLLLAVGASPLQAQINLGLLEPHKEVWVAQVRGHKWAFRKLWGMTIECEPDCSIKITRKRWIGGEATWKKVKVAVFPVPGADGVCFPTNCVKWLGCNMAYVIDIANWSKHTVKFKSLKLKKYRTLPPGKVYIIHGEDWWPMYACGTKMDTLMFHTPEVPGRMFIDIICTGCGIKPN